MTQRKTFSFTSIPRAAPSPRVSRFTTPCSSSHDVVTYCIGQAASMAAFLLMSGNKGKRFALPNSRILIHQPSMGGLSGQATDIDIHAREILRIREITNKLMSKHTAQPLERIERDVEETSS